MMKAKLWKLVFIPLAFVILVMLSGVQTAVAQRTTDVTGYDFYGWIRNNAGFFTDNKDYAQSGNDLAIMRTWARLNADLRFSNKFDAGVVLQLAHEPTYKREKNSVSRSGGKEYSEYDDINYVLRECWVRWKPSPNHSFKFGRQIIIWGEAFTPISDVVQYSNGLYDPGFTNIEDARIPEWQLRSNHFFEGLNTEFEWIVQFNWISEEFRNGLSATPATTAGQGPQRWTVHPEDRALLGFPPIGDVKRIKSSNSLDDTRFGFRTTSFNWNTQWGFMFWQGHSFAPVGVTNALIRSGLPPGAPQFFQVLTIENPKVTQIGCYANRDMEVGLLKWDFMWSLDAPYNTFDTTEFDGVVERDTIKYMLSWEINSRFWFDWHKTASFDVTLTHTGQWIPDAEDVQHVTYANTQMSYEPAISIMGGTSWIYGLINTNLFAVYYPKSRDGMVSPSVRYSPSWMNGAWSFSLAYNRYFGEDNYHVPFGALQQNDYVVLTSQFSF